MGNLIYSVKNFPTLKTKNQKTSLKKKILIGESGKNVYF